MHSYNYSDTYFRLTYLIILIVCLTRISTSFVVITIKKGKFIFCWGQNFVPMIQLILIFLIILKLLYESYIPLSTSFIMLISNHIIKNQTSSSTSERPIISLFLTGIFHGQCTIQIASEKTEWNIIHFLQITFEFPI